MPSEIKTCTELTNFPHHNILIYFIERFNFIKAIRINVRQQILEQVHRLPSDKTEIDRIQKQQY
jgi:hypothetical protein